ncbi:MAG: hypothetical protein KJZ76_15050, partial [Burkholderiaceae bacterium]|nr:hypothetical protein [Burkholderiaceae bacterium]
PARLCSCGLAGLFRVDYFSGRVVIDDKDDRPLASGTRRQWEKALFDLRWNLNDQTYYSPAGKRVHLGSLGPSKNGISVQLNFGNPSWFHRWLFSQGALAVRYAQVRIPVLVAPMREFDRRDDRQNRILGSLAYFEYLKDQLETLAPLSSTFPFLILGVSDQQPLLPPTLSELPSDPNITTERVVIDRCIEFPREYHQAGLGILNYFGTFLRENYPDREAKVRIEQQGLTVRMTVETTDGNVETIEKALRDYELVVTGRAKPEAITTNERVILDIRNELRIAQFRIESQQDIIDVQNRRIDKLMDAIAQSLHASQNRPIEIQVNPTFNNSNAAAPYSDISAVLNSVYELLESLPPTEEAHMVLNDLTGSLEAVESESDPEKLKNSPGVTKLGRFLRRFADGNEALSKAVSNVEKGQQIVGDMARTYNKLASFCGLPTIPLV